MESSSNERGKHQGAKTNGDDEINFVSASIASQSFGEYLGDTDTDPKTPPSHLAAAMSGIASSVLAPVTTLPGPVKQLFASFVRDTA